MDDLVFLDTEFTDLLYPELLSLGLVTHDAVEHYVELDMNSSHGIALQAKASIMVLENVLSQWGFVARSSCSRDEMGKRTAAWLLSQSRRLGTPVRIAFDYPTDYELLVDLLSEAGHWATVRHVVAPYNVKSLTGWCDANRAADEVWDQLKKRRGLRRHHALADAHALRGACIMTITGSGVVL